MDARQLYKVEGVKAVIIVGDECTEWFEEYVLAENLAAVETMVYAKHDINVTTIQCVTLIATTFLM